MTQAYIDGLLALAVAQARAVKIPVSRDICPQVRLNRRARTRFGCCIRREGRYTIELSARPAGRTARGYTPRPGGCSSQTGCGHGGSA